MIVRDNYHRGFLRLGRKKYASPEIAAQAARPQTALRICGRKFIAESLLGAVRLCL